MFRCASQDHRIFKLQKKAVRIISRAKYNAHTSPLFTSLNLLKIHDIFTINKLKFYFKLAHRLVPSYFLDSFISFNDKVHEHCTRQSSFLRIPVHKHVFFQQCLRYSLVKSVNECEVIILEKIYTHSLLGFSEYAKRFFINNYSESCCIRNCHVCVTIHLKFIRKHNVMNVH